MFSTRSLRAFSRATGEATAATASAGVSAERRRTERSVTPTFRSSSPLGDLLLIAFGFVLAAAALGALGWL